MTMSRSVRQIPLVVWLFSVICAGAIGGSLSGTVKDPAGAVVAGARVIAINALTNQQQEVLSDAEGRFRIDGLQPGDYRVQVDKEGFKLDHPVVATVTEGKTSEIEIKLQVAGAKEQATVSAAGLLANSDANYRALRDGKISESYQVDGLVLKRDMATITLRSGTISFLPAVLGRVNTAVFAGDGEFSLAPEGLELDHLKIITGQESVLEPFERAVLCFTDATYDEIRKALKPGGDQSRAASVLSAFRGRSRSRGEDNIDAQILADLYNPRYPGFFRAYIFGRKHSDLRFSVTPRSFDDELGPEEVALTCEQGEQAGIWYLRHLQSEYASGRASSDEDKRTIATDHYKIDTVIDSSDKLTGSTELSFTALVDGERILHFGLLPALRVSRVAVADKEIPYIQEREKGDGSFYAILPEPLVAGKKCQITIDYQGHKVVSDAGGGNFAVGARTSWYPSVGAFRDHATFDLTFRVPKHFTLVGVGKRVKEWQEGGYACSEWVCDQPIPVAGFNYGEYKKKEIQDPVSKYSIEVYVTKDPPAYLQNAPVAGSLSPAGMADSALVQSENSVRIFDKYFGDAPYGRIAITQQPAFNFGQSWPTLVYLPVSAFLDSTQRYLLMGLNQRFSDFTYEVASHEVSHQWWGHMVGWSSYHDQWLSEGFASFSAGLYFQVTEKTPDKYLHYWDEARKNILAKNQFGYSPNDAGPIWLGLRLITQKTPSAYFSVVYFKGAYVLQMLRSIMFDRTEGDKQFIDMMHDFVRSNLYKNASTETFMHTVEKHMTPRMDLDNNGSMAWFFKEWVYGTEIPSYKLDYTLTPEPGGKFLLDGTLTQGGVADDFKMLVPLYLDFDGKLMRMGLIRVAGNKSATFRVRLPQKPKRVLINAFDDVLAREVINKQD